MLFIQTVNKTILVVSTSQIQHLISMFNQISSNNNYKKSDEETVIFVASHIKTSWARSMRERIIPYAAE
ncbi:MAG: hypothetical protein ACJAZQ_002898, partial [Cognaticolwellia sp.]